MPKTKVSCQTCGKDAPLECSRCKRVSYCNAECQSADWGEHKKVCFAVGVKCTRCLLTIDESNFQHRCTVPHPPQLVTDRVSKVGPNGVKWTFHCQACDSFFTRSTKNALSMDKHGAPITSGPKFCYSASRHTTKPLRSGDERRVRDDVVILRAGPNLQTEIDSLPSKLPAVKVLLIDSRRFIDEQVKPTLAISLPHLESLKLNGVLFEKIVLNTSLTPNIKHLTMNNIPHDCELTVVLPQLVWFSMHYYGRARGNHESWIHEMLANAKRLQTFNSYRLCAGPTLTFASNHLKSIRLHRAEFLEYLTLYTPGLQNLSLQECYNMHEGELRILDSYPDFEPPPTVSLFEVDTMYASISPAIIEVLEDNPRVIWLWQHEDSNADNSFPALSTGMDHR